MNELRTMHLFAGIGGGMLADLILGHKPIIAVEWDKYACRVLRERSKDGWFPNLSVYEGDVRLFDPSEYTGRVDCIHAGFPCQDISVAGKQAGLGEGTRSGLYREVLRIAGVVRPRYIFLENVSAILSNGLGCVLGDLAEMGYDCRWLCIRASDVGAPHGRDRWFCLSIRNIEHDGQFASEVGGSIGEGSDDCASWAQQACEPARSSLQYAELANSKRDGLQGVWKNRNTEGQIGLCGGARGNKEQDVCNTSSAGLPNRTGKPMERSGEKQEFERPDWWQIEQSICGMVDGSADKLDEIETRPDGEEGKNKGRMGGAGWWEIEADVGRLAHGVPNRVDMLKGLGNAQVPLQAAAAFRLLHERAGI